METSVKNLSTVNNLPKVWNISLWIAQVILAAMFIMAGLMKTTTPIQELAASLPLATQFPPAFVRFIGISELLGGVGLLLPGILKIKPILTPYAALGLFTIMVLAIGYHIIHGEFAALGINFGLGLLAAFVAWGRFKKATIDSKPAIRIRT